jgi:hypothetical protein
MFYTRGGMYITRASRRAAHLRAELGTRDDTIIAAPVSSHNNVINMNISFSIFHPVKTSANNFLCTSNAPRSITEYVRVKPLLNGAVASFCEVLGEIPYTSKYI